MTNAELNALFAASWPRHAPSDFTPVLERSLLYACAYSDGDLVGYVNLAWDGGVHAFLLDTTVHPRMRRQGIGVALVRRAVTEAQKHRIVWVHVDYEPHLRSFYEQCGFRPTEAGLIALTS